MFLTMGSHVSCIAYNRSSPRPPAVQHPALGLGSVHWQLPDQKTWVACMPAKRCSARSRDIRSSNETCMKCYHPSNHFSSQQLHACFIFLHPSWILFFYWLNIKSCCIVHVHIPLQQLLNPVVLVLIEPCLF